jgi:hypothetical protein
VHLTLELAAAPVGGYGSMDGRSDSVVYSRSGAPARGMAPLEEDLVIHEDDQVRESPNQRNHLTWPGS